jgi:uncharacterized protein YcbK (DUF882 family)
MKLKHFKINEFDSPDEDDSGMFMQHDTLQMLDQAREIAKVPFKINSGFRTKSHNEYVGGTEESSHLYGYAVDIHCTTSQSRYKILDALRKVGFSRFGISDTFIHVDNDPDKPNNVIWTY